MEKTIIYHNPRCSTSRKTLALLQEKGEVPEIREYLKNPLSAEELTQLLKMLGMEPLDIIRQKEPVFIERYKGKKLSNAEYIQAIIENPILMERPVVVKSGKAVLGRPPEKVLDIL